jgi:hypothetical protein
MRKEEEARMSTSSPVRLGLAAAVAAGLLLAGGASAGAAQPKQAGPLAGVPCAPLRSYLPVNHFPTPTKIDNRYFPLVPGTQYVLEGRASRGGAPLPHKVTFTVTDVTMVIGHTTALAVWDVDEEDGAVVESELGFFAQDDRGNVWSLGEYPEEFEEGAFAGASSTWFARRLRAVPGVLVPGDPDAPAARRQWLQGFAPRVEFLDCATVSSPRDPKRRPRVCVPAGCFDEVLTIDETSPLDPEGGTQIKYYAPGVGNVQIGAVNDPEAETLVLTRRAHLDPAALAAARAEALKLDAHGRLVSARYARMPPMVPLGG